MPCRRYVLYMVWNKERYRLGLSANPQIDLAYLTAQEGYENMAYLSSPVPLAFCEYLLNLVSTAEERVGKTYRSRLIWPFTYRKEGFIQRVINRKFKAAKREMAKFGQEYVATEPVVLRQSHVSIDYFSLHRYEEILDSILQGRILYLKDIVKLLKEREETVEDLEAVLHLLVLKGMVTRIPSVKLNSDGTMSCNRCGHQYRVVRGFCSVGQKDCYYCQECLMLGESRPCEALYAVPARMRPEESLVKSVRLNLDVTFSLAQYEAFEGLVRFTRKDGLSECLVWEACGAGRPEVVFGAVREVLKRGGRVLFGVPRRDILEDLVLRLERAFPGVSVAVRYGKSKTYNRGSDIVLVSTHHALKYYRSFDLVILDESDAFPHRANPILIHALRRAKKSEGKFIYMTPTPPPEVYARAQRGEVKVIQIPVRQHGKPLAVPKVIIEKELAAEAKVPDVLLSLVRESLEEDQYQVLVVVPDAYRSHLVGQWLAANLKAHGLGGLKEQAVMHTFSGDPERDRKVQAYFRGEHDVLVTTNLTSRGDRAPNSNLIVLWADSEIFDEGCLMQLAGRIGWSEAYPVGKVWFVASRLTRDMEAAIRKVKLLNEEAQKRGYLEGAREKKNTAKF